jgi:hypothetical protein
MADNENKHLAGLGVGFPAGGDRKVGFCWSSFPIPVE